MAISDVLIGISPRRMIMPKLHMLPPSIMEKIVLPQLLTQEFFAAEGFDKLYRSLFTPQPPQPLITEEVYRAQVMPFMIKLWTYRQADIRLTILRLFEVYLKAVVLGEGGSEVLGQIILPEILAGLQDADPKVYFASLCGLATAIPYVLLVTTLVDTDLSKQKFSVKSLYEQTLIPQIMAFWISEDCVQESKVQLIEVVMGMWCSIYTLGLHNHAAVKDMSATLTLTLVSVLKLLPANERVELISKSFTKHCTNGLFCISGLLKFLPQFLLDEDVRVREAAAKAISEIAFQTINLMPQTEITEQQDQQQQREEDDSSTASISSVSSPSPSQSTHVSRIRQYCEMQQLLLPPRRPIFSRSTFAGDRSASSNSLRNFSGSSNSAPDLQSSRRSSIVSQDSFMFSDQGSLKTTPSLFTPSLTRAGSFSGDTSSRDAPAIAINGLGSGLEIRADSNLDKQTKSLDNRLGENGAREPSQPIPKSDMMSEKEEEKHIMNEDLQAAADQLELMKALETAKAEMKIRQLPVVERQGDSKVNANATRKTDQLRSSDNTQASAAFKWDDAGDGENDDWDNEDLTTLAASSRHSPSPSSEYLVEDEATRLKREKERAEKQEQLRLKRDQKQQEMQAKREARRQQMAEKQGQKKSPSNGLKLSAVRATPVSVPSAPAAVVAPKPVSGHSMIHLSQGADIDDKDNWDVDEGLNMGDLDKQLNDAEADELFKDLEVSYKPAYVGLGSTAGHVGINGNNTANISGSTSFQSLSTSSSTTLLKSPVTISTAKTLHSSFTTTNMTSVTTTTTTAASTGSASLGIDNSQSRETSPTSTPKRAPSPLLKPTSNSNSNLNNNSNIKTIASPTINSTKTSSLAPQMDEAALEEADDWENAWS
ncbi:hypothetical protein BCR41DRAFT_367920 [Lobosporangium transversale]|uniref:Uncharacterized protein n=1 Tax=Lobosporangium transversale TaxID=64571 RepID=A0A1Y2GYT1_9FUNG|nr:hypothetical protein BCR41DRAFT_367920 [Lobosporangium transversale]ORZ26921.1 hypothetical protein BCR41DRAFT_367920 [Lobosporangium transversale]|eukprot:XP_021884668.1 hypothetical protein BCR41DRAFT_367920 [Lobosporangium transversale]